MDQENDILKRVCGGCTACCKTHLIYEISKPWGMWCSHCSIGKGCLIYADRPSGCQKFSCQWLLGFGKEEERPDRMKIVVDSIFPTPVGRVYVLFEVTEGALGSRFAQDTTQLLLGNGYPIYHVPLRGESTVHVPPGFFIPAGTEFSIDGRKVAKVVHYRAAGIILPKSTG